MSIGDSFDQGDWEACQLVTGIQEDRGDPTFTNPKRIAKATGDKSCNCLPLKVKHTDSDKVFVCVQVSQINGMSC